MVLDTSLHNSQHYKVRIKGKWRNPRKGVAPVLANEKGAFSSPLTTVTNITYMYIYDCVKKRALIIKVDD